MAWETDEATARARLEREVAWETTPKLTVAEVDDLVVLAKRTDYFGLTPSSAGWTPTWDIRAAALEGWRWKMAKATAMHTFSADGASFNRAEILANCEKMIQAHQAKKGLRVLTWANVRHRDPLDTPVIGNL